MSQAPVPVKRERAEEVEDLSVRESNAVPDSLHKFQEVLDSKFPLQRLRDFYDEAKIKEVAKSQREEIYKEFMGRCLKFTGSNFIRLTTELENGLEKILEDLLKKNKDFREAAEFLFQETICLEFKKTMELHLNFYSKPDMELGQLQQFMCDVKSKFLQSSREQWNQWNGKLLPHQITKLTEKLNETAAGFRRCILERPHPGPSTSPPPPSSSVPEDLSMSQCQSQTRSIDLKRPGPSATPSILEDLSRAPVPSHSQEMQGNYVVGGYGPGPSTSTASISSTRTSSQAPALASPTVPVPTFTRAQDDAKFDEMKRSISRQLLLITEAFPRIFSSDDISPKLCRTAKASFDWDISQMRRSLLRNNGFIEMECRRAYAKLVEILEITEELMNSVIETSENLIPEEDAAALVWAMDIDARETLSISTSTEEGKLTPSEWGRELIGALKNQCLRRLRNWDSEGKVIQEQLKLETEGIEKDKTEKEKPDAKFEPELLLNRLRRIWEARQRAYAATPASATFRNLGNKRRRRM